MNLYTGGPRAFRNLDRTRAVCPTEFRILVLDYALLSEKIDGSLSFSTLVVKVAKIAHSLAKMAKF